MSSRILIACALGILLLPFLNAQEKMRNYDPDNSGRRRQSVEPPLADENGNPIESPKIAPVEPKRLPMEVQARPKDENGVIPAQSIQVPSTPKTLNPQPVNLLATPVVTIDVVGGENAAEGMEVKYIFVVRNRSEARAHHVLVRSFIPKNGTFIKASIPPKEEKVGEVIELHWPLESLNPGEERKIEVFFKPNPDQTEMKVLARVQFDHGRWMVTKIGKAQLTLKKTAPKEGVLFDAINYRIEVSNPSKVAITDVKIEDQLGKDDGMEFERDPNAKIDNEKNQRTWSIPILNPGEKKVFDFTVIAKKIGVKKTLTRVIGSGIAPVEEPHEITIHEARLQMKLTPDHQATVGQAAELKLLIENKGTATLNNVRVNLSHPQDIEVKRATNGAQFFKDGVQWIIPKFAAGETRTLTLQLTAKTPGKRKFVATSKADRGQEQQDEATLDFEGIASLNWKTDGTPNSSEGKDVKYTVEIWNPGSANATNVVLQVKLPPQVRLETANPIYKEREGGVIAFSPIHVPPKTKVTYTMTCLATQKGVATFHFDLLADHLKKAGSQHNEVSTTITGRDKEAVPTKNDRTTSNPTPATFPLKESPKAELKIDPKPDFIPVKKSTEPKDEKKLDLTPVPSVPKNEEKLKLDPVPVSPVTPKEEKKLQVDPVAPVPKDDGKLKLDPVPALVPKDEGEEKLSPIAPVSPPKS